MPGQRSPAGQWDATWGRAPTTTATRARAATTGPQDRCVAYEGSYGCSGAQKFFLSRSAIWLQMTCDGQGLISSMAPYVSVL